MGLKESVLNLIAAYIKEKKIVSVNVITLNKIQYMYGF